MRGKSFFLRLIFYFFFLLYKIHEFVIEASLVLILFGENVEDDFLIKDRIVDSWKSSLTFADFLQSCFNRFLSRST